MSFFKKISDTLYNEAYNKKAGFTLTEEGTRCHAEGIGLAGENPRNKKISWFRDDRKGPNQYPKDYTTFKDFKEDWDNH